MYGGNASDATWQPPKEEGHVEIKMWWLFKVRKGGESEREELSRRNFHYHTTTTRGVKVPSSSSSTLKKKKKKKKKSLPLLMIRSYLATCDILCGGCSCSCWSFPSPVKKETFWTEGVLGGKIFLLFVWEVETPEFLFKYRSQELTIVSIF